MYDKLKLWFFRDLTDYQRRQLFSVFGMPVDEIGYSHGKQEHALRHVVRSLIMTKPDTAPAPQVTPTSSQGQPRCWLLEEHCPDGTTRLQCFDYKLTVVPLYEPVGEDDL